MPGALNGVFRHGTEKGVSMIADDMTRLSEEIVALRSRRGQILEGLAAGSNEVRRSMLDLCRHFARQRAQMARGTRADRGAFLHNLKNHVNQHLRQTRSDLAGVRRAWAGR